MLKLNCVREQRGFLAKDRGWEGISNKRQGGGVGYLIKGEREEETIQICVYTCARLSYTKMVHSKKATKPLVIWSVPTLLKSLNIYCLLQ